MIEHIKHKIKKVLEEQLNIEDLVIEEPKKGNADISIPLFSFAKKMGVSPLAVYDRFHIIENLVDEIDHIEFLNGFLNIYVKRKLVAKKIIHQIQVEKNQYGNQKTGEGQTIVMDYSSPNIAKSFGVGHLRSTVIGNSIKKIYEKLGYQVIGINHLGDWGTQFGKMIVAYEKWGKKEAIDQNPIEELQKLYVKFHDEEAQDPSLEDQAREVFLKLEKNNPHYMKLWTWFKDESMKEFMEMYDLLNVSFDSYDGESFYNDKMDDAIKELEDKNLLKIDDGATIVDLGVDLPPALIKKSDGATLYMTRDLAALLYRARTYHTKKVLYVVGNEQQLHFKQLQRLTNLLGYDFEVVHVGFGLVMIDGKKMSTRGGKFKRLEDVIIQAIHDAKQSIIEKNPSLKDQDKVSKAVGIGAIIFNDLKNERHLNVDFSLENMLKFEGQTGPYLQYTGVRIHSILKDQTVDHHKVNLSYFEEDHYFEIIKLLAQFPVMLERAKESYMPSVIARYLINLAQGFNSFYGKQRIQVEDEGHYMANLLFLESIEIVLKEGLRILGIESLEEM
ncbi:MAG: arginine--tRNA ligase [Acholeplasmataceae bacterium]|nr:arginine--tRNA ligase [Acholeplasmataceae bacterium]